MIEQESLLVTLVRLVNRLPLPPCPPKRGRGRPETYPDRLFLQALVIMIVRHLHTAHELLSVLEQPTPEMQTLRSELQFKGRNPTRRTWERRLKALPASLPALRKLMGHKNLQTTLRYADTDLATLQQELMDAKRRRRLPHDRVAPSQGTMMLIKRTRSEYPILGTTDDSIELEAVFGLAHATEREQAELDRFR